MSQNSNHVKRFFSGKDFTALRWSTKSSDLKSTIWMFGIGGFLKTKGAPAWYYQAVTDVEVSVIKKKVLTTINY